MNALRVYYIEKLKNEDQKNLLNLAKYSSKIGLIYTRIGNYQEAKIYFKLEAKYLYINATQTQVK